MAGRRWGILFLLLGFTFACSLAESSDSLSTPSSTPFLPIRPTATIKKENTPTGTNTVTPSPSPSRTPSPSVAPPASETLRTYADLIHFGIGALYQKRESQNSPFFTLLTSEFNVVIMTTFMKRVQPEEARFDWSLMDSAISIALAHNQKIMGGPLVYKDTTAPDWLGFSRVDCGNWRADALESVLREYIRVVIAHSEGRVFVWEVVNEPLTGSDNCWRKILGDRYIDRAFQYAREADPEALLLLNEAFGWGGVDRDRADRFLAQVKQMKKDGIPIDAVGIEMHLDATVLRPGYPEEFRYFLEQAGALGIQVLITEMDVYQGPPGYFQDPFGNQKTIFRTVAEICLKYPHCTNLLFWGVSDKYTWLLNEGFLDVQPLLFDVNFQRKPAYYGVAEALYEAVLRGRP